MELEYDIRFNIGYIKFKEKVEQVTSLKISEDLVIDINESLVKKNNCDE